MGIATMRRKLLLLSLTAAVFLGTVISCSTRTGDSYLIPLVEELGGKNEDWFYDTQGDTFGFEEFQYDIVSIGMFIDETETYFIMHIMFNNPVSAPSGGFDMYGLVGYLEIDADQNPSTGFEASLNMFAPLEEPLSSMGVDYSIQFFEYDQLFHTLPVYRTGIFELTGYVNIEFGESSCTLQIPLSALPDPVTGEDNDGNIDFGFVLGTVPEPTDIAHTEPDRIYSYNSNQE
jgi:hypothetical protein